MKGKVGNAGGTVQPRSEFMPVRPSPFLEHRLFCRSFRFARARSWSTGYSAGRSERYVFRRGR